MTNKPTRNLSSCCCTDDEENQVGNATPKEVANHDHGGDSSSFQTYVPSLVSFILLIVGLVMDYSIQPSFFHGNARLIWYLVAFFPVGWPVIHSAIQSFRKGSYYSEFTLMSLATIGAFAIGEYPEAVTVMLFYSIGELFQDAAVKNAKGNIEALLDQRPKEALVLENGQYVSVNPETVPLQAQVQVRHGEKVPLDGILISDYASVNTAALSGESLPQSVNQGDPILAGSINMGSVLDLRVTKGYNDSSIAKVLELVQHASTRKSETELLIRRLAKIYTPVVFYLALAICIVPYFLAENYVFEDWLYRALVFLVISCPCALVISIPLGYFGGLGAASKNGILFKGATYLDQITAINTVAMDKTGTVTLGQFQIKDIVVLNDLTTKAIMRYATAIEAKSTHPIAKVIQDYPLSERVPDATSLVEIAGKGLSGKVEGHQVIVGNKALMEQFQIPVPDAIDQLANSLILVGIDNELAGYITIADTLKPDALQSIQRLRATGIKKIVMLSGDKDSITKEVAASLGIEDARGGLLPEDKFNAVEALKLVPENKVAFVGDGINDAPVIAASDVGIAMGAMGSDIAIETADVIIQTDQPSKIATAIDIGKATNRIIWQNIALAFGVKLIVLILGALGLATMWQAVFADVGVALLAILNAVRLQHMDWE